MNPAYPDISNEAGWLADIVETTDADFNPLNLRCYIIVHRDRLGEVESVRLDDWEVIGRHYELTKYDKEEIEKLIKDEYL